MTTAAVQDLERALRVGSAVPEVLETVLARHPIADRRDYAARLLAAHDRAGDEQVLAACIHLLDRGDDLVLHARRFGNRLSGWVARRWADPPALRLTWEADAGRDVPIREDRACAIGGAIRRWTFDTILDVEGPVRLDAAFEAGRIVSRVLPARPVGPVRRDRVDARRGPEARTPLTIVVPIYGDPASLTACLGALRRQALGRRFVVIDDASPDPEVSRLGRDFCRDLGGQYRRNALNAGFAASVNLGLSLCGEGDVLVLNSDVLLPDHALERLGRAAHASADIGIVAPLSNDAGNTTFPDPMRPGAAVTEPHARSIDAAAKRANDGRIVDVPSVLGSCLYLTRACLDRVGSFSLAFGRGYFEDVDLCLRAQEHGFRVVAACDVYVSHISGRSFKDERYALITRNGLVLDARFPDHRARDAAHDAADPLRSARAAIEEWLPAPAAPSVVLLGRQATAGPIMEWREERLRSQETIASLRLDWRWRGAEVAFAVSSRASGSPRCLTFLLDDPGRHRLSGYLARCEIARVEVFEPEAIPASIKEWLAASGLPVALVVDGREAATVVQEMRAALEAEGAADVRLCPADEKTAAHLATLGERSVAPPARGNGDATMQPPGEPPDRAAQTVHPASRVGRRAATASPRGGAVHRLGVLMPALDVAAERLVGALGSLFLSRGGPRLIIFGRCVDEPSMVAGGNVWVTGALTMAGLPDAIVNHGVDALFLPYRDGLRWVLEASTSRGALPCGSFDGSFDGVPIDRGHLALGPHMTDDDACTHLLTWCMTPRDDASE